MLNLLRKFRKKLISEGKIRNYLIYAIGEIVLIVVGILIAIQINNWNTDRRNNQIEISLLEGIRADLVQDTIQVSDRFFQSYNRLVNFIDKFDSIINLDDENINMHHLDSIFSACTRQRNTFWPVSGTFESIVSNGSSYLITNKNLFKEIQDHYEKSYEILISKGYRIDMLSDKIRYKVKDYKALDNESRLEVYRSKSVRNEIEYWFDQIDFFKENIISTNLSTKLLIDKISVEIQNKQ